MSTPTWAPPCPVCGTPAAPAPAPCGTCGLPAVAQAATVVARLGATIDEFSRERDALVATLRAAAGGGPVRAAVPVAAPPRPAPPGVPAWAPPLPPAVPAPPPPAPPAPARVPRRRVSPQQVLEGLGALLVVAASLAFVAVAWTRLGVTFQAAVMAAVTAAAAGASAWTARRGLRATEEALAAAGAALLAVDLGAAHALGLWGADALPGRLWAALSCALVALAALGLGRLTRTTVTWPAVALLAAQPVALLLLPEGQDGLVAGVAVLAGTALADVLALLVLRRSLHRLALGLAALWAVAGALRGLVLAWSLDPVQSWTATVLLGVAGAVAVPLLRELRPADPRPVAALAAGLPAVALSGSLSGVGVVGPVVAVGLGLVLLAGAAPVRSAPAVLAGLLASGAALGATGAGVVAEAGRTDLLALLALAAAVPAALAAVLRPELRAAATGAALVAPGSAAVLASDTLVRPEAAGLLLAAVAAVAFGVAALRAPSPEEATAATVGGATGLLAGLLTWPTGASGLVAVDLAVAGAAAGVYALVTRQRLVAAAAVAELVVASWIAAAGAEIRTPEVYTLPAAAGLLLLAVPALRSGAPSWAAEGAALAVALVPSAVVVVADPTAVRLTVVVVAAAALTVAGTLTHRQAPFVVGAGALVLVVAGRLGPYAPLVPRWVTLATVGLVLLVVGATYERRRQQAREAVAWVAQMR